MIKTKQPYYYQQYRKQKIENMNEEELQKYKEHRNILQRERKQNKISNIFKKQLCEINRQVFNVKVEILV